MRNDNVSTEQEMCFCESYYNYTCTVCRRLVDGYERTYAWKRRYKGGAVEKLDEQARANEQASE